MHTKTPASAARALGGRARLGKPRLLIVGCGDVGLRIVARLNQRFRIFAVTASKPRCQLLRAAGAVPVLVDLDDGPPRRLTGLASRVIHLVPPPPSGPSDTRVAHLVRAWRRAPQRFVYISTTGVYGDRGGRLVDETARPAPATGRARRRLDGERRARAHPWHAAVLRVPGIYGP